MSGGSWEYAYSRVQDVVDRLQRDRVPERRVLGLLLDALPAALKAIEWEDSGDTGPEDTHKAILACVDAMTGGRPLPGSIDANRILLEGRINEIQKELDEVRKDVLALG